MNTVTRSEYDIWTDRLFIGFVDRLDADEYIEGKKWKFSWWPAHELFSAVWTPEAEDWMRSMGAVDIVAQDDSPEAAMQKVQQRTDRFYLYALKADKEVAYLEDAKDNLEDKLVNADPSEYIDQAKLSKQLNRLEGNLKKEAELAEYWRERVDSAIAHKAHMEDPGTIMRRIDGLQADLRKVQKQDVDFKYAVTHNRTIYNLAMENRLDEAQAHYNKLYLRAKRWIDHLQMRIAFETYRLELAGGGNETLSVEEGGLIYAHGQWYIVRKVNAKSVRINRRHPDAYDLRYPMKLDRTFVKKAISKADFEAHGWPIE